LASAVRSLRTRIRTVTDWIIERFGYIRRSIHTGSAIPLTGHETIRSEPKKRELPRGIPPGTTKREWFTPIPPHTGPDLARHPTLVTLGRRAFNQLFDYYGMTVIPGEAWAALEHSAGQPVDAFRTFALWVGCDPERLRRRDPLQLKRMQSAVDLLAHLHALGPNLSSDGAEHIRAILKSSSDAELQSHAERLEALTNLQAIRSRADGLRNCALFMEFIETIEDNFSDPLTYTLDDIQDAFVLVERFIEGMRRYSDTRSKIDRLAEVLQRIWTTATVWDTDVDVRDGILLRTAELDGLYGEAGTRTIADVEACAVQCETLLGNLFGVYERYAESDEEARYKPSVSEEELALEFFGFPLEPAPSDGDVRAKYRILTRQHHTDNPENRRTEEERLKNEKMTKEIDRHFSVLMRRDKD
jgi:hypothetical protein